MKKKPKFVPFDPERIKQSNCYNCKKKNKDCKCISCKFCDEFVNKGQGCKYCKKRNIIKNFMATNAELNALEDMAVIDLKTMFKEKRDKEIEVLQDRCKGLWHKIIRKIDD